MKERFVPLIHINCPPEIKCQKCISVVSSASIQQLHIAVMYALDGVSEDNKEFFNILVKDQNIIPHLASPIIQFVSQSQLNKKKIQQQQQYSDSFEQYFIYPSQILINKLINNNTKARKQIINTPNFLNSLIKLTEFKFNNDTNKEEDNQSKQIRNESRICLRIIHRYGNEQVQVELVTNRYPRVLVIDINTAGGNEQLDKEISQGLYSIIDFIREILRGRRQTHQDFNPGLSFPPQPVLFKSCQEQIEDEGANEEIEAQLVNKREGPGYYMDEANWAKGSILNIFIDNRNPQPQWYK
ncbi:MAG: hypothetical protein EZS28_025127 [Streblomastix strix]|uniref:Uncharacterized protein n=1 Tax=Streblomastix strix TaxID=222440 RepID=A0A5J4V9V6_9EUKA|nr:MAG: hypothetical protein EZS28_025127 [Streblomastix strix]